MRSSGSVLLSALSLLVASASSAVELVATDDVTVNGDAPDDNYSSNTFQGGLFLGGNNRFYLQFQLPVFVPGTVISSATLTGYYQDELFEEIDGLFGIFLAAGDAWDEGTLTWNNQPGPVGSELATWDAAGAAFGPYSFDLTAAANAQYQGDGVVSVLFKELVEDGTVFSWEYWHSKEALPNPDQLPFVLDVTITPVPEPGSAALLALGLAGLGRRLRAAGSAQSPGAQ